MRQTRRVLKTMVLTVMAALWLLGMTAAAEDASGDNSLYSLGLENGEASPEFYYSTLEYNVTVPGGTTELLLNPVTSDNNANIIDISGTQLDENGNGTVYITVEAQNGAQVSYILNVTSDGAAAATEAETPSPEEQQASQEEELRRQAESEEALRQEAANKANQEKLAKLETENANLVDRLDILLKVLYGLIAFAVLLLFFIINQSLRNKDLKDDLKEARSQVESGNEFARKEANMRTDYYYAPVQGRSQGMPAGGGVPLNDVSNNMQAVFGNAPQKLQAQPIPGQAAPVQNPAAPAPEVPLQEVTTADTLSRREQKKLEKAAKKAEKQTVNEPVQETLVQGSVEEPDVGVDMIDL